MSEPRGRLGDAGTCMCGHLLSVHTATGCTAEEKATTSNGDGWTCNCTKFRTSKAWRDSGKRPCGAEGCVNGVVRVWDVGDKTDGVCERCGGTGLAAPRSIRQWDEALDLGGRSVPLRRLHLEGILPGTVRHAFRGETKHLAGYLTFAWVFGEPSLAELREAYLAEEGRRRAWLAADPRLNGVVAEAMGADLLRESPHAWWVSASWDGVVMHAWAVSRHTVWREGVQFYVGIDEVGS